ncbi:hypothetical protein [Myceligenerans salitolerans]|uniref:Cell division protein FtsL n=1 Tax=Myceligenerans salitolerans TaxID=1230528 RepID=A0ABS3I4W2_9MICO|nr:hypothetical protein [Myceligenerans salitolerans]MBO0607483.1 hypothetical protein [Myceligenerans salitolerans]
MSAARAAAARTTTAPTRSPSRPANRRPSLTAIPGGAGRTGRRFDAVRAPLHARSKVPFLVLCATILLGALVTALVLNTTLARGSYEMARLQSDVGRTAQDVQGLQEDIAQAEANLADTARSYGMVPAENPIMLSVETGKVVQGNDK